MGMCRRLLVLVLLLTVPFQTALGASGLLCLAGAHHPQAAESVPPQSLSHRHDIGTPQSHHHDHDGSGAQRDAAIEGVLHASHSAAGKCKTCSECCSTAAAILSSTPRFFLPDTALRVSPIVAPDIVSRAGDDLFRPPRIPAV